MDIDKQYLMEYGVDENGVVYKYTKLTNPRANVNDLMQLPLPTGRLVRTFKDYMADLKNDRSKIDGFELISFNKSTIERVLDKWNNGDISEFNNLLDYVNKSNGSVIYVYEEDETSHKEIANDELSEKLAELLNTHNGSQLSKTHRTEALKNRVVNRIVKIMSDPRNYINAHKPIDMSPVQKPAKKASSSQPSMYSTDMNATTKFNSQVQSILGKECVGIEANANKTFNLLTIYTNQLVSEYARNKSLHNLQDMSLFIQSLLFKIPIMIEEKKMSLSGKEYSEYRNSELSKILNNLNLDPLIKIADGFDHEVFNDTFRNICQMTGITADSMTEFLNKIKELINNEDTVLNLSALINSSTDNAKELTLAKINATQDTIDVYNALVMAGCNIGDIAEIMTSPIINVMINRSHKNMFRPESESFSLVKMIDFYNGTSTLPFLNSDKFKQILNEFIGAYDKGLDEMYDSILTKLNISDIDEKNIIKENWKKHFHINYIKSEDRKIPDNIPDYAHILYKYKLEIDPECREREKLLALFNNKNDYQEDLRTVFNAFNGFNWYKLSDFQKDALTIDGYGDNPFWKLLITYETVSEDFREKYPEFNGMEDDMVKEKKKWERQYAFEKFLEWLGKKSPKKNVNLYGYEDIDLIMMEEQNADQYNNEPELEPEPDVDAADYGDTDVEYFGESYVIRSTDYSNAIKMMSYYEQAREDLNIYGFNSKAILEYVKQARDIADEISIVAAFGKINQGIETNSRDAYAYIKRINDYFNNKIISSKWKAMDSETKWSMGYNKFVRDFYMSDEYVNDRFDLYRFLNDNEVEYRKRMIDVGNTIKKMVNVADLILNIPHFKAMAKSLVVSNAIINKLSIKAKIQSEAIKLLPNMKYTLKENEFNKVEQFANNYLIYQYFMAYGDNIKMQIRNQDGLDCKIYENGVLTMPFNGNNVEVVELGLNSIDNLATFKYQMEHNIIPKLRLNLKYHENMFMQAFNRNIKKNTRINSYRSQYKLPINMARLNDSNELQVAMDNYTKAFNDIANQPIDGMYLKINEQDVPLNIGDAIFLYNLYVNKDNYSQTSLTNLFMGIVNSDNHIVKTYYNYLAKLDGMADSFTATEGIPGEINPIEDMKYTLQAMFYDNPNKETNFNVTTKQNNGKTDIVFLDDFGNELNQSIPNISDRYKDYCLDIYPIENIVVETRKHEPKNIRKVFKYVAEMQRVNMKPKDMLSRIREVFEATYNTSGERNIIFDDNGKNNKFGWIKDGKMYINTESDGVSWTTPLHELSHLVCANIKFSNDANMRAVYDKWLRDITNAMFDYKDGNLVWKEEFTGYKQLMPESIYGNDCNSSDYREELLVKIFENELSGYSLDGIRLDTSNVDVQALLISIFSNNQDKINPNATLAEVMRSVKNNMMQQAPIISFENALKSGNIKKIMNYLQKIGLFEYKCK